MKMKNKLIKFILSFTDYDRIKKQNEKLKSDLRTIIESPHSIESLVIIQSFEMDKMVSKMYWMGDLGVKLDGFEGIVKHSTI